MTMGDIATLIIGIASLCSSIAAIMVAAKFSRRAEFNVSQWRTDLHGWAARVIELLTEAAALGEGSERAAECRDMVIAARLSALIEVGRLYLPNQDQGKHGLEKLPAYQGYRHQTLDSLVAAVRLLSRNASVSEPRGAVLIELQKVFLSDVWSILGPVYHNQGIAAVVAEMHHGNPSPGPRPSDQTPSGETTALVAAEARARRERLAGNSSPIADKLRGMNCAEA